MKTAATTVCLCFALLVGPGAASAADRGMTQAATAATTATAKTAKKAKRSKKAKASRRTTRKSRRNARKLRRHERRMKKMAKRMNRQVELNAIDSAYDAGSLTWNEAAGLYAEQGVVRQTFINHRGFDDRNLARIQFVRDTARASLARLRFNLAQRIYVDDADQRQPRALATAE